MPYYSQTDAKVPGTNCTWLMKASQISDTKWEIREICMKHNKACLRKMEVLCQKILLRGEMLILRFLLSD
jgi:hypothetical protein